VITEAFWNAGAGFYRRNGSDTYSKTMKPNKTQPNPSKRKYCSDALVDLMKALGIEYVSLNPGASFRGLHDSIVNYGGNQNPELILCCQGKMRILVYLNPSLAPKAPGHSWL